MAYPPQGNGGGKPNWLNHLKLNWSQYRKICCEWRTTFHWQISDLCHSSKSQHQCHLGSDVLLWLGRQGFKMPDQSHLRATRRHYLGHVQVDSLHCDHGSRSGADTSPHTWELGPWLTGSSSPQEPQHARVPSTSLTWVPPTWYHSTKLRASGLELFED